VTLGIIGAIVGILGFGAVVFREIVAALDRRRARPIVVIHEDKGRHFRDDGGLAVRAYLTNESAASAFNIRFGVELAGVRVPYAQGDEEAGRQNVLAPGERLPELGGAGDPSFEIRIPDEAVWVGEGDPDPGRAYWAIYQSASEEWWTTRNPVARDAEFEIKGVRWFRRHKRKEAERLADHLARGAANEERARQELLERITPNPPP
jgi:hypothetical protein